MNIQMPELPTEPALRTNSFDPIARAKSVESQKHSSFGLGDRVMSRVLSALLRHSHTSQGMHCGIRSHHGGGEIAYS